MNEIEIKKAYDELGKRDANSAREIAFIVLAMGVGIWKWDVNANTLEWDDNMFRLYGLKKQDFSGAFDVWESALSPDTRERAKAELKDAVSGVKDFNTRFQIRNPSGKIREVGARAVAIRQPSGGVSLWGTNVDCSREAELEKEMLEERSRSVHAAKLASIGEMAAGVAHEINNPLATVEMELSNLELVCPETAESAASIKSLRKASHRIARIVAALTKYARTGDAPKHVELNLGDVLTECLVLTTLKAKNQGVTVGLEKMCSGRIFGDEVEVEQVIINLINNAIDAASVLPEKWVTVTAIEDEISSIVQVRDCGKGISKDLEAKLFEPFFTTKEPGRGTGLGLSISRKILESHGGSLAYLREEKNTCF